MTIDHIAAMGLLNPFPHVVYDVFRSFGRIAAPLFLFVLVQGLHRTRSKPKYILRLYIAAALVEAVNTIFEFGVFTGYLFSPGNILPTLMYTALYITCVEYFINAVKNKNYRKVVYPLIGMVIPFIAAWAFRLAALGVFSARGIDVLKMFLCPIHSIEYSLLFVLLGVAWYFVNSKMINCLIFAALSGLCYILDYSLFTNLPFANILPFNFYELFLHTQWCMVLAVPFIAIYNGQKGKSLKYLFYVYYPLHQYLLFWLAVILFGSRAAMP
jgi:hypothetical protein